MSAQKLLVGGLILAAIAAAGFVMPANAYAGTEVLALARADHSHLSSSGGAVLAVELPMDQITDTITSTLPVTFANKVAEAITRYFTDVTVTQVISMHNAGFGFGGIFKVFMIAQAAGTTPDEIMAMREAGMGWGEINKELDLHPGNKGKNLGSAVSGRGISQTISTTLPLGGDSKNKGNKGNKPAEPPGKGKNK